MLHLSCFRTMMFSMILLVLFLLDVIHPTTMTLSTVLATTETETLKTTLRHHRHLATGGGNKECGAATNSTTAYIYQRLANAFLTAVDNIANDQPDDVNAFYQENVAAYSTDDVVWDIDAGTRQFQVQGTEAVSGLFESFSTRRFAFHQWSHFEVDDACDGGGGVTVALRYHGVTLEAEGNYQDIFGIVRVRYNADDLVEYVFVQRFHTIDRGYSA